MTILMSNVIMLAQRQHIILNWPYGNFSLYLSPLPALVLEAEALEAMLVAQALEVEPGPAKASVKIRWCMKT